MWGRWAGVDWLSTIRVPTSFIGPLPLQSRQIWIFPILSGGGISCFSRTWIPLRPPGKRFAVLPFVIDHFTEKLVVVASRQHLLILSGSVKWYGKTGIFQRKQYPNCHLTEVAADVRTTPTPAPSLATKICQSYSKWSRCKASSIWQISRRIQ